MVDLSRFSRCSVMVVGDLMIDQYLWGKVERISPEAPVPVLTVENEEFMPGGAGNVVNNLLSLGARAFPLGVIGTGAGGERLLETFRDLDLDTSGVFREPDRPTTRKARLIAGSQHMLRLDWETRRDVSRATLASLIDVVEQKMPSVDIVLISDYDKGLVTRTLLTPLIAAARLHGKPVVADPKGRDFSKYGGVSILTPNRREAADASGIEITDEAALAAAGSKLLETIGIGSILLTCGKDGMVLFEPGQEPFRIRSEARQVFDVSGAGDTVLAVLGLAVATGSDIRKAADAANTAAGIVVGKMGTATVSRQELHSAMEAFGRAIPEKHKTLRELKTIAGDLKKKRKKIVLTNGCFDLLHAGHVDLLSASKRLGDILVVALDDDASVRRLKGPGRPVIAERERVRILDAMDAVDYIVTFSSEELGTLIEALGPDVLTKGSNYTPDGVEGRALVEKLGGRVELVPVTADASSTRIINGIKGT